MDAIREQIQECEDMVDKLNIIVKQADDKEDKECLCDCIKKINILKQCLERTLNL